MTPWRKRPPWRLSDEAIAFALFILSLIALLILDHYRVALNW